MQASDKMQFCVNNYFVENKNKRKRNQFNTLNKQKEICNTKKYILKASAALQDTYSLQFT